MPQSDSSARKIQEKRRLLKGRPHKTKKKYGNTTNSHIKCNELNLQHSRAATDNLMQMMSSEKIRDYLHSSTIPLSE